MRAVDGGTYKVPITVYFTVRDLPTWGRQKEGERDGRTGGGVEMGRV